jgi:hypothetical protein
MSVLNVPQPAFMEDEEIAIFADAVGKFYQQHAPQKRVEKSGVRRAPPACWVSRSRPNMAATAATFGMTLS